MWVWVSLAQCKEKQFSVNIEWDHLALTVFHRICEWGVHIIRVCAIIVLLPCPWPIRMRKESQPQPSPTTCSPFPKYKHTRSETHQNFELPSILPKYIAWRSSFSVRSCRSGIPCYYCSHVCGLHQLRHFRSH